MSMFNATEPHLVFSQFSGFKAHLGVTGSIAAYKALDLLRLWQDAGLKVSATLTDGAREFVSDLSFAALGADPVYSGMFAPGQDPLAHLRPGVDCDLMIIAPASADCLARLAQGCAGDMLCAQALAFDKHLVVAPAMNPRMWANPATQRNWQTLLERGIRGVTPGTGRTACLECGEGRLADLRDIYLAPLRCLAPADFNGKHVLVTLGPTREFWDGVRFLSNPSSGLMGASLAVAAWLRGAQVTAVCGPGSPWLPKEIERVEVTSATEMLAACQSVYPQCAVACFCAAVADFRFAEPAAGKVKKSTLPEQPSLDLLPNPDILATLSRVKRDNQIIVGFAAETAELEQNSLLKLNRKAVDVMVGNLVNQTDSGFGVATNCVYVSDKHGRREHWPVMRKPDVAWRILDWCAQM